MMHKPNVHPRCDENGVPTMIQWLAYNYSSALWQVIDFAGGYTEWDAVEVDLLRAPTRMQYLQAESRITKELETAWHQLNQQAQRRREDDSNSGSGIA